MEGYELQVVVSISSSSFPPFCLPINSNNKHFNLQSPSQTTRTTSPSRLSHSNLSTSTSTTSTPTNQPTNQQQWLHLSPPLPHPHPQLPLHPAFPSARHHTHTALPARG